MKEIRKDFLKLHQMVESYPTNIQKLEDKLNQISVHLMDRQNKETKSGMVANAIVTVSVKVLVML